MALRPRDWIGGCAPGFGLGSVEVDASDGPVELVLEPALRLELTVVGTTDFAGLHVEVQLPDECRDGPFHQEKYVTTPGRAVDGTVARWELHHLPADVRARPTWRSCWSACLPATGTAVLDQIACAGPVTVQLLRFGRLLDERALVVDPNDGPVRLAFAVAPAVALRGVVVDAAGRGLPGARLRMAPYGGARIVDSPNRGHAFPVWAPETESGPDGGFVLPRPDDEGERIVVTCPGCAARAVTVGELDAAGGRLVLSPGHTVRVEILDCNGAPLDGGWTTGGHEYMEPSVLLGHDVWRGTSDQELPWFEFAELPAGVVAFRCAGETLRHDARIPVARMITAATVESMHIGK